MHHDPETLIALAELGHPRGPDAVLDAVAARLARRRRGRLLLAPVAAVAMLAALAGVPMAMEALRSPDGVAVAGPPAVGALEPCPEGDHAMRRSRIAALAATMLLGCTGTAGTGEPGPPAAAGTGEPATPSADGAAEAAPMVAELTGDLEGRITLAPSPGGAVARETDEEVRRAWAAGELELPTVEYSSDDGDLVVLSWPRWDEHRDPSQVSLTFRIDGHLTVPRPGACRADLAPAEEFVIRGTIDCEGLTGVKPGVEEGPVYDAHLEVTYRVYACVSEEQTEGGFVCRPVGS